MDTNQLGVIACRSTTPTRQRATPQKTLPYKAWPGIKKWNKYFLFPTVNAIYFPEYEGVNSTDSDYCLIRHFPQLESFRAHLVR